MVLTAALPLAASMTRSRMQATRAGACQPSAAGIPSLRLGTGASFPPRFSSSARAVSRKQHAVMASSSTAEPGPAGVIDDVRQPEVPSLNMPQLFVTALQSAAALAASALKRLAAPAEGIPGLQLAGVAPLALTGIALSDLRSNVVFMSALYAWFAAQVLKVFTKYARTRAWDWRVLVDSGGMPSSHTALVVGLTAAIALQHGLNSTLFPLSLAFSLVVMYDAAGVRRHAGKQAEVLNALVEDYFQGHPVAEQELKEVIGHTPLQVAMGAVLGVATAILYRRYLL